MERSYEGDKVRLDGWYEGGLGQQRNDGTTMRKSFERVESPEFNAAIFAWPCVLSDHLPCSGGYHLERGWIPLHDAVGIDCKRVQLLKIMAQMSSIWAKGCMLMIVRVLSDLTLLLLLGGGRKSWYIIIIKNCWQCKAGRERLTPYLSEDPSPTIPTHRIKEEKWKNSRRQKGSKQLIKGIGLALETHQSHTIEYGVTKIVPQIY